MRVTVIFIGFLAIFTRAVVAATGGSVLAHCYEAIYLYYGYLADMSINGATGVLGKQCVTESGGVCTVIEFLKKIQSIYDAAGLKDLGELGDTTRPADVQDLAYAMAEAEYTTYDCDRMFDKLIPHTHVLNSATSILITARDEHPSALDGGLLAKAKETLLYIEAERAQDTLADKIAWFKESFQFNDAKPVIEQETVYLDAMLTSYQDINWMANAEKFAKSASSKDVMQQYEGYKDFADNLTRDPDTPKKLGTHLRMLQNIRTQSDQLGTLATCKALA